MPTKENYDYIIIGGGSAGCVLANRLTADQDCQVLLVEAGTKKPNWFSQTPALFARFMFSKRLNWHYQSMPEADVRNGQSIFTPRGRLLGGSSAINAMIYIRGQRQDYDAWAQAGNAGWDYASLHPYFIAAEHNSRGASEWHGDNGPLRVSDVPVQLAPTNSYLDACNQLGLPKNGDFNGRTQTGYGRYQFTWHQGKRYGARQAYLDPIISRPNLTLLDQCTATKIELVDGAATGVWLARRGKQFFVKANHEVLLAGGSINSPQLLMLSGIGDAEELQQHGIECRHELPGVGKNLQEHVDAAVLVKAKSNDGVSFNPLRAAAKLPELIRYIRSKTGLLSSPLAEAGGFFATGNDSRPDIQVHFMPALYDNSGKSIGIAMGHGFSCHVCVLRPRSRGAVRLASSSAFDAPVIDYQFLSDQRDVETMLAGIRLAKQIMEQPAFTEHYQTTLLHPKPEDFRSDETLLAAIKSKLGLIYHPVGTCKMGPSSDPHAVVNDQLKVHGVKKLRVIDASIMPTLISGNTNAPTMVIAERAADLILNR